MHRIVRLPGAALLLILYFCSLSTGQTPDASVLLQEGDRASEHWNYSEAHIRYEQAFQILERANDRPGMASVSLKLGTAYSRVGMYAEAEKVLQRALKLHKELQDRQSVGLDLVELAGVAKRLTRYEESLQLAQEALAIHEEFGNRKGIADSYRSMGIVYQFQGEQDKALDYSNRSLLIATEIGDKEGQSRSMSDLGGNYWRMGNLDQALDYYQKALALAEELEHKQMQSKLFGNIALVHWNRGQLQEALDYFQRSQVIAEEGKDLQTLAINYFNIGALQKDLEEYGDSRQSLQKGLKMSVEIGDRGLEQACMDALGQLHADMGDFDIALDFMQKAATIAEDIGEKRSLAYDLKSIASLHARRRKYSDAIAANRKALSIYEELQEKRGIALTHNDLADIYLALKNEEEAMPHYEKAVVIAGEMKSNFILVDSYRGMGWLHYAKKEMPQAEEYFTKSIDLARDIERPESIWEALYGKSLVYRDTEKPADALQLMKEAVEIIEDARNEVQLAEQKAGYLQEKLDVYEDLIRLLVKTGNSPEAFEYAQRAKSRSFLDMLAEGKIHPEGKIDAALIDRKKKLLKKFAEAQRSLQSESENDGADRTKVRQLAKTRNEMEYEFNNLRLEIRKEDPRFSGLQYPRPLTLNEAQAMLDNRTALLEYSLGRLESFLFVITKDSLRIHSLPSEQKLTALIKDVRSALLKPEEAWEVSEGSHTIFLQRAATLYKYLFAPAESKLAGVKALVIAPDGILNYLPFECLLRKSATGVDFTALPYVGLDFEIQYVPSATVLAALKTENAKGTGERQKEFLAFADPVNPPTTMPVSALRESSLLALPNTRVEVEAIARLFPNDRVAIYLGPEASEQNVKKIKLDQYKRVHFASHGVIDEERPEFSSLLLKGADKGEDGYLMMREVFDLSLRADLVVLSACKTGLGQQIRGEGIMGLSRAFLSAGAASVLVSLWNVPDKSTSGFMTTFYESLVKKGLSKAAAVRQARLALIQSEHFSHPYYWAPFVLIGNP